MKIQDGQRVVVYFDHHTRTKVEGTARVVKAVGHNLYRVKFEEDWASDTVFVRIIQEPWSVCAWCRSFIHADGGLIRSCSDDEYDTAQTHGICTDCKQRQLNNYVPHQHGSSNERGDR
jgi:hypothetical protein